MLQIGDVVAGRFTVEALVGSGGMASVYRVRHQDLGTVHALKMLFSQGESMADRLILEGQIQARLVHPNVVSVTDVLRHGDKVGLLMEYIDADSLIDLLDERGALPEGEVLGLMGPVLHCVDTAHKAGILHRDLKPANILLRSSPGGFEPMVTDFGIARVRSEEFKSEHTADGIVLGSPGYMSPEQFLDPGEVDVRSDVFSLGAMLYEMLAGERAFKGKEGQLLLASTYIETVVPLSQARPECSASVCDAVMKALEKEPVDRHADIPAFVDALYTAHPGLRPSGFFAAGIRPEPAGTGSGSSSRPRVGGQTIVPLEPSRSRLGLFLALAGLIAFTGVGVVCLGAAVGWKSGVFGGSGDATSAPVSGPAPADVAAPAPAAKPEPLAGPEEASSAPAVAAPNAPSVPPTASAPVAAPAPDSEVDPLAEPQPVQDTEPGTEEEAVAVVTEAPEDLPEPAPEVPALPSWAEGTQTLKGQLYRQSFALTFKPEMGRRFTASGSLTLGSNSRRVQFSGEYFPETSTLRFQEVDGDLVIEGVWSRTGLKGTYWRGRRKPSSLTLSR